jgi:hypothetical protein
MAIEPHDPLSAKPDPEVEPSALGQLEVLVSGALPVTVTTAR